MSLNNNFGIPRRSGTDRSYLLINATTGSSSVASGIVGPYYTGVVKAVNLGSDFNYTSDPTNGTIIQIINEGLYFFRYNETNGAGGEHTGWTVNELPATFSTQCASLTTAQGLIVRVAAVTSNSSPAVTLHYCYPGDILRPRGDSGVSTSSSEVAVARVW